MTIILIPLLIYWACVKGTTGDNDFGRTRWQRRATAPIRWPYEAGVLTGLIRPDQPDRLIALEQIEECRSASRAAWQASGRARRERGVVACRCDQLAVHLDARDAEARHAGLARAEDIAFAAQAQVLLGDAETVFGRAKDLEPRLAVSPSGFV